MPKFGEWSPSLDTLSDNSKSFDQTFPERGLKRFIKVYHKYPLYLGMIVNSILVQDENEILWYEIHAQ